MCKPGLAVASLLLLLLTLGAALVEAEPSPVLLIPERPAQRAVTDDDRARAARSYEEVQRRYGDGDLPGALAAADEAFRAVPNASTALIRATILGGQGRHREAFAALLVALDLEPTAEEQELIRRGLAEHGPACTPPLGWARFAVEPADARITVAGVAVPVGSAFGIAEGTHDVRVEREDYEPLDRVLAIRAGGETTAAFTVARLPDPAAVDGTVAAGRDLGMEAVPPAAEPVVVATGERSWARKKLASWILIGSGAALLGVGAGMHVWALDAADETTRYSGPIVGMTDEDRQRRYDQANDDMKLRGTLAYVFYGVGAAAAVTGVVLLFIDTDRSGSDAAAWHVVPSGGPSGGGLVLQGTF